MKAAVNSLVEGCKMMKATTQTNATGAYPATVKLSKRCVAWRSSDIRALIASF